VRGETNLSTNFVEDLTDQGSRSRPAGRGRGSPDPHDDILAREGSISGAAAVVVLPIVADGWAGKTSSLGQGRRPVVQHLGAADLIYAGVEGVRVLANPGSLGAAFFLPTAIVPSLQHDIV
jgi:hypothetical protein